MTATLEQWQHESFLQWLGTLLLEREKEAPGLPVKISDDLDLLERAYRAGWARSAALENEARFSEHARHQEGR